MLTWFVKNMKTMPSKDRLLQHWKEIPKCSYWVVWMGILKLISLSLMAFKNKSYKKIFWIIKEGNFQIVDWKRQKWRKFIRCNKPSLYIHRELISSHKSCLIKLLYTWLRATSEANVLWLISKLLIGHTKGWICTYLQERRKKPCRNYSKKCDPGSFDLRLDADRTLLDHSSERDQSIQSVPEIESKFLREAKYWKA